LFTQGLHVIEGQDWEVPPPKFEIPENELHIWRTSLEKSEEERAQLTSYLSHDEQARAERFVFARDREHFVAAHGRLRELLGGYLGIGPDEVRFEAGPFGKPFVRGTTIRFNMSHSKGLAVYAFALGREVGIDTEKIRPEFAGVDIAERYFSNTEQKELRQLAPERQPEAFFLCWTRKEAYVKAHGKGLQIPLDSFDVSLTPGGSVDLRSEDSERWGIWSFKPENGFAGAVVAEGRFADIRYFGSRGSS
jgi:4'-phosphopantetheinyl transferase